MISNQTWPNRNVLNLSSADFIFNPPKKKYTRSLQASFLYQGWKAQVSSFELTLSCRHKEAGIIYNFFLMIWIHLCPAEIAGCRQQTLHFMAECWTGVTHLHAAFSSSPLQTKVCHWSTIGWRSLEVTHRMASDWDPANRYSTKQNGNNGVIAMLFI